MLVFSLTLALSIHNKQITDLFRTTHKVKTPQVARNRGQWCGNIELGGYLTNAATGPVPLVMDLRIFHKRFASSSDPSINGHLHFPNDLDCSLNESAADKIRQYHTDNNNRPSNGSTAQTIIIVPLIICWSACVHVRWGGGGSSVVCFFKDVGLEVNHCWKRSRIQRSRRTTIKSNTMKHNSSCLILLSRRPPPIRGLFDL